MTKYIINKVTELSRENSKFNYIGFHGVGIAGQTTNIDFKMPNERWMEGGTLILTGHMPGDRVWLQVVDVDNLLGYGAGLVLGEHVTNIAVDTTKCDQGVIKAPYIALIAGGLYIRVKYLSTGIANVLVSLNLITHIPSA